MPFVANGPDDEEDQQNQSNTQSGPVPPSGGGAVHLTPQSGVGTAAPGGTSGEAPKAAGGNFATLNQYLDANQGQAAPLANKIMGQINNQYNTLNSQDQGVLSNINGEVTNAPGYTASNNALIAQESADPVSFANNANNVSAFQQQLTDSYGGPTNAEGDTGFQSQQAAVNNAIAQGQTNTTTDAGRQSLIAQNSAAPTAGVTALNSSILSQDPTYLGQVQNAYQPFNNLVTNLSTGAQNIDQTIAGEQADAANAVSNSTGAINNQINGLNSAVNNQLTTDQSNATTVNNEVNQALTTGQASPTILSTLGISQNQWNALTSAQKADATSDYVKSANGQWGAQSGTANVDLNQFNTQLDPNAVFTTANVATPEQYQDAQAFQTLINGLNLNTPQAIINQSTASQAGTAPTSTNSYNYTNALGTTQGVGAQEQAAAQAYVAALQSGADEAHAQQAASVAAQNANIAGYAGSAVGGTVGAIYGGPIGAEVGATVGNIAGRDTLGNIENTKAAITAPSIKTAIPLLESVATAGLSNTVKTIASIFCFHPFTLVEMADGALMPIYKIMVGDMTRGGKVMATTRGVGTRFYWYKGVLVTGKHAVKEDGKWIRIETSPLAKDFHSMTEVVCNLVTESHRIWSNGVEFADEHETDQYEMLNLDDSLAEMNKQ